MKEFINLSADEREAMGKVGRTWMEKAFDKKKVIAETVDEIV